MAKTIVLDFDGVIHNYGKWLGASKMDGGPIEGAKEFIEECFERGYNVSILSSRNGQTGGVAGMQSFLLKKVGLSKDIVSKIDFPIQKPPHHMIIDDRAVTFNGVFPDFDYIEEFRPWNKV